MFNTIKTIDIYRLEEEVIKRIKNSYSGGKIPRYKQI